MPFWSQNGKRHADKSRRTVNVRLAIGTVVGLGLLSVGGYFWHSYQVGRLARAFLVRADRHEEQGDWTRAADSLQRYLRLHPEDLQVRVRLASTADRGSDPLSTAQAIEFHRRALRAMPEDQLSKDTALGLRQRLGELLMEAGDWKLAEQQAELVLSQVPQDSRAMRVLALARHAEVRAAGRSAGKDVQEALEAAHAAQPHDIQIATLLAELYRGQAAAEKVAQAAAAADQVMDRVVQENPQNAKAYLARYTYRLRYLTPDAASADLDEALRLEPSSQDVLLAAAQRAVQLQKLEQAQAFYEQAIRAAPQTPAGYLGLAELYLSQKDRQQAIDTLNDALRQIGDDAVAIHAGLAELLIAQQRLDEAQRHLTTLRRAHDRLKMRLARVDRLAFSNMLALLQGKLDIARGEPRAAIPHLKQVALTQQTGPDARRDAAGRMQALLLLGTAYAEMKQWDQAARAFEQGARLDPSSSQARVAAGDAWAAGNQPESAIGAYRQAIKLQDQPETRLRLTHALLLREQLKAPENRDWKEFQEALRQLRDVSPAGSLAEAWRVRLVEVEFELAQAGSSGLDPRSMERARALLQEVEHQYPDSWELGRRLVIAYERLGFPADSDRVLRRLEQDGNPSAAIALLQAQVCGLRREYERGRNLLAAALPSAPHSDRRSLRQAVAESFLSEGRWKEARDEFMALVAENPSDAQAMVTLAELAMRSGEWDQVERWENELRRVEGAEGTQWRMYLAHRLISQASGPDDPDLVEAEKLLRAIEVQRPGWSAAYVLAGVLNERLGKPERAIEAYDMAVRLGESQLAVFNRLLSLLYRHQHFEAANRVLARLHRQVPQSQSLSAMAISGAVVQDRLDEALHWARQGTAQRPGDATAWTWLGALLMGSNQNAEAETAFRQAVKLAPQDTRAWHGLSTLYVRTGQKDAAHQSLQRLAETDGWTPAQKALVLAQGYEQVGDRDRAERYYQEAATLAPDMAAVHMSRARFYMKSDRAKARQSLRRVLELTPESGGARRTLAALLASEGGQDNWQQAIQLLESSAANESESLLDRRLQVVLLVQRGETDRARQLLEELVEQQAGGVERLWLARIYEQQGSVEAAREQLMALASGSEVEAAHLAELTGFVLRHDGPGNAEPWLKKLEELAPNTWTVVALRARWHHRQGALSEVGPLVDGFVRTRLTRPADDQEKANLHQMVADLYQSLELYAAAERSYREMLSYDAQRYALLAQCLMRQGQVQEAIRLCSEAAETDDSTRPAVVLANLLTAASRDTVDVSQAESILSDARRKNPKDNNVLMAVANFRLARDKYDEAIELYRELLSREPRHVVAMNNLAVLLSEHADTRAEALRYIDQAIQIAGQQANLIDTKAEILLQQKRAAEALALLERIAGSAHADPRHLLHLAVAHWQLGAVDRARKALQRAQKSDLGSQLLSPADRQWLKDLQRLEDSR